MFTLGYISNSGHEQLHDFWDWFSIFNKATKLQKNRKTEFKKESTYRSNLPAQPTTVATQPGKASAAQLADPAHLAPCRLPPLARAGRLLPVARALPLDVCTFFKSCSLSLLWLWKQRNNYKPVICAKCPFMFKERPIKENILLFPGRMLPSK